jgi:hypothetical protein
MRSTLGPSRVAFRSGLVGLAILAMTASAFVGTANAARSHHAVAPLTAPRGFSVIRSVRNPDGTVAATLRSKSGARIYYLGKPGVRISLVRQVSGRRHGHKETWRMTYGVAVHMPSSRIPKTASRSGQNPAEQLAALRSAYSADAARGGFPESVAKAFVKDLRPVTPGDTVGSTCISFYDQVNVDANGCDTRTALQSAAGNSYLADSMPAQIVVTSFLAVKLTRINDWMNYTSTSTNNVVALNPQAAVSTNCSSLGTWTITWKGVSFTAHPQLCGGTMTPWGLTDAKGGVGWTGGTYSDTINLSGQIEDHNTYTPGHTNPTSVYDITTVTTAVTLVGQCPFGTSKCG